MGRNLSLFLVPSPPPPPPPTTSLQLSSSRFYLVFELNNTISHNFLLMNFKKYLFSTLPPPRLLRLPTPTHSLWVFRRDFVRVNRAKLLVFIILFSSRNPRARHNWYHREEKCSVIKKNLEVEPNVVVSYRFLRKQTLIAMTWSFLQVFQWRRIDVPGRWSLQTKLIPRRGSHPGHRIRYSVYFSYARARLRIWVRDEKKKREKIDCHLVPTASTRHRLMSSSRVDRERKTRKS